MIEYPNRTFLLLDSFIDYFYFYYQRPGL